MTVKTGKDKSAIADLYPLTPLQQGLWFHERLDPESRTYFIQSVMRIEGSLNRDAFRRAWQEAVARHPILRTRIVWEGLEHPLQLVQPTVELPWTEQDWRDSPVDGHQVQLLKFLDADRVQGFDLTQAPLMRLTLLQVAETSALFVWSFHHLILDRWSVDVVQQEVWSAYQALVQGQALQFNSLRPYREYLGWLQDQDLNRAEQYWRHLLRGFTAPTVLGVDQAPSARVEHPEIEYDSEEVVLSEAATTALTRWARQQQLTVNTVVQGALAVLLSRYSGSEDVVFGATVSGRSAALPGIETMVGLFINTLPVRVHVSASHSVVRWLTALQEQQVTQREYEYTPLFEVQKWSEVPAGESLFDTLLVFENTPLESGERLATRAAGLDVQPVAGRGANQTNYPLAVIVVPGRTLRLRFEYDTGRYAAEAVNRMVGHFQRVLAEMVGGTGQQHLGAIPLLTEAERQLVLGEWNATERDYPRDLCLHDLFEAQVERTPDAVALVFGEETFTYDELNTRANHLAHYLRQQYGVGPEVCVGVCMERSTDMVVGILGILKAGGAYVPLDPNYPSMRLAYILEDAQVGVLITQDRLVQDLPQSQARVVCVDTDPACVPSGAVTTPETQVSSSNVAYLIYTSGSTGKPKGVTIEHRSAVALLHWAKGVFRPEELQGVLASTSICFDLSVFEMFVPLSCGGTVILAQTVLDLPELPNAGGVTLVNTVPSGIAAVLRKSPLPESVRTVNLAGEPLRPQLVREIQKAGTVETVNDLYGPSEDTTYSTRALRDGDGPEIIGRPIANTQAYLLDRYLEPVPIGVSGELYLGGEGLVRGYYNRPALTAEKFIPNPFSQEPGARLYKTGDVARYLSDGTIQYLGRLDHQVKVRGYRIELGEIETVLGQLPDIKDAAVVVREDSPEDKRVVAYVVPSEGPLSPRDLRQTLKQRLPEYMVPAHFVTLDALPLTPNGKVDRRALPAPDRNRSQPAEGFVAPRDELELQLAKIWEKVLGIKNIGREDNFFDLGGHSLLAVRLFDRIEKKFGKHFTLATLFQAPTIGQLARIIRQGGFTAPWSSLVPIQGGGSKPPFFCLHGCFGEVAHFYDLARLLGPEQPFYGVRALGLEKGQVPQTRFEDMAAHYIKEIRTIQSDGPYFIGGSGAGCAIALEIAHQLESQGQNVTLLALMIPFDLKPTNLKPNSSPKTFSKFFRKYIRLSKLYFSLLIIVARSRLVLPTIKHFFLNRVLWHLKFCRRFIPGEIHRLHRFEDAFSKALQSYEPEVYQGRITCFLNDEYSHNHKRRHNKKRRIDYWYDLAVGGLDVRVVPGDTFTMWREPHVQILAEQLKASLDEALTDIDVQGTQSTPTHAADAETGQDALAAPRVSNQ